MSTESLGHDGHILRATLEQATILMQDWAVAIRHVVVDLGFRGVDADNPDQHLIHRGKFKRLSPEHRTWLRRRSAVEPAIGHLKADHRLDRCWLKGALGDALHAISCAAGYNIQWLLRYCPSGAGAGFFAPAAQKAWGFAGGQCLAIRAQLLRHLLCAGRHRARPGDTSLSCLPFFVFQEPMCSIET